MNRNTCSHPGKTCEDSTIDTLTETNPRPARHFGNSSSGKVQYVDLPLALTRRFRLYRVAVSMFNMDGFNGSCISVVTVMGNPTTIHVPHCKITTFTMQPPPPPPRPSFVCSYSNFHYACSLQPFQPRVCRTLKRFSAFFFFFFFFFFFLGRSVDKNKQVINCWSVIFISARSKHMKNSKERLLIMTQTHNMQILGIILFVELQNDTLTTDKRRKKDDGWDEKTK